MEAILGGILGNVFKIEGVGEGNRVREYCDLVGRVRNMIHNVWIQM